MNGEQYNKLCHPVEDPRVVKLKDLTDQTPRTLAYGYTPSCPSHLTWHLYLNARKQFVLIIYEYDYDEHIEEPELVHSYNEELPISEIYNELSLAMRPQRLYPESCDYEFMKLLQYMGVEFTFTKFNPIRFDKVKDLVYHGKLDVHDRIDQT